MQTKFAATGLVQDTAIKWNNFKITQALDHKSKFTP